MYKLFEHSDLYCLIIHRCIIVYTASLYYCYLFIKRDFSLICYLNGNRVNLILKVCKVYLLTNKQRIAVSNNSVSVNTGEFLVCIDQVSTKPFKK